MPVPSYSRLLLLVLAILLAACASPSGGPPAGQATAEDTGGWVELGNDIVIDESIFERVTPQPVAPVTMSQAEAKAQLPFAYALPAWAPAGFVLQNEVEVVQPESGLGYMSVSLIWLRADEAALRLQVAQADDDQPALGAAGSSQAVTVNGQPASLVHATHLGAERLALTWPRAGLTYTLSAEDGAATPEELQRMAESVAG